MCPSPRRSSDIGSSRTRSRPMAIAVEAERDQRVRTRRIDGDSHFSHSIDSQELRNLLPRQRVREAEDMMWRDAERFVDPTGFRVSVGREKAKAASDRPDPQRNAEARLTEMDKLGFDTQVLITQNALPSPLRPQAEKPLWLRSALA